MKNTGPDSPQTIRGLLNRRSQRGLLDTRVHQEADILTAPMVGPFGKGFHTLHTPAGTEYVVGDASGITFAPNAQVMVANPGGLGDRAVLGGAPANKKGAVSRSRNPRRRGTVVLESNQYAFGTDGVDMHAMLYSEGTYVSTRATATEVSGSYTGCILTDSSLLVGDGSLLMKDGDTIKVWDVEGATFYTYTATAGWLLLTAPYYQNGLLYWVECEDFPDLVTTAFDVRLRSAATDLTGTVTIQATTLDISDAQSDLGGSVIEYFLNDSTDACHAAGIAVDANGAVVYFQCRPQDGNGERTDKWKLQFRFLLVGGAPTVRQWSDPETVEFYGATIGTTSFVLAYWNSSPPDIYSKTDDASASAAILWPTGTLSSIGIGAFNVGTGGSVLQVHSYGTSTLVRGVGTGAVITTSIDAFDTTPNYPTAMFYYGE